MNRLRCLHGSSATPQNPERFEFELYNYTYDPDTQTSDHPHVNSGLDAEGPGIYVFAQPDSSPFNDSQMSAAQGYSGKDGKGSVLGFSVPMDDTQLANELPPDAVPAEEWAAVIEEMVTEIRAAYSFDFDNAESLAHDIQDEWEMTGEPPAPQVISDLLQYTGKDADVSVITPDESVGPDEWLDNVLCELDLSDPAQFILQEGDPLTIAESAIDNSDHLWETLKRVFHYVAVENRGNSYRSFNAVFASAVKNNLSSPELVRAAAVNDGHFYVIFDTSSIQMEYAKVYTHDINPQQLSQLTDEIGDMMSACWSVLEPPQLKMKLNEIATSIFGKPFSDDLCDKLRLIKGPEGFYSGLLEQVRDELSTRQEKEWVREPGFTETPKPDETLNLTNDTSHQQAMGLARR